jgi:hypothetical protein
MRSAVRSRLAPPAFARFASFRRASRTVLYRSEVSEGCLVEALLGQDGLWPKILLFIVPDDFGSRTGKRRIRRMGWARRNPSAAADGVMGFASLNLSYAYYR